jgi:hypothetical protein
LPRALLSVSAVHSHGEHVEKKIAEWNKLSAVAAETRAHAEQGDAAAQLNLESCI